MRAIVCETWGGPETLKLLDRPSQPPGPNQVQIRVRAAGVNFPDVLIIQNKYQLKPELPFTPGSELAGDVIAVGEGVRHVGPGDRVAAFAGQGAFAEEATVPADVCLRIPDGLDYDTAAAFTLAYGTSWHALRDRAVLLPGETLLVLGAAGGVGLSAVDIAKAMGAKVIAAASSWEKLEACRRYGIEGTIDYSREDLRGALKTLCPKGPDVIYDPVGGDFTEQAFRSIGWKGRHLVIGFAAGPIPSIPANLPLLKGASLVGVYWGAYTRQEPEHWKTSGAEMVHWLLSGKLKPLISHRYLLAETPQALTDMAARKVIGKVVIVP
ncbi:MAG TPA: NADPH:quinone oxidoreductase family protein [Acidisphaera sp.]|nr:NADPH:quinone oxidoreductase family protein [Acidisphaera sp.]